MNLGYLKKLFSRNNIEKDINRCIYLLEIKKEILQSIRLEIIVSLKTIDYSDCFEEDKYVSRVYMNDLFVKKILFPPEEKQLLMLFDKIEKEINEIKEELGDGIRDYIDPLKKFYPWK